MALSITHLFVSTIPDDPAAAAMGWVVPGNWNAAHVLSGVASPAQGGTGTATAFTQGSIVFAGASGVYSQDNANFFWDAANTTLTIGSGVFLSKDATGILAMRDGGNRQAYRAYNIYTDASNYERGIFSWKEASAGNVLVVGTQYAGSGVARGMRFLVGNVPAFDCGVAGGPIFYGGNTNAPADSISSCEFFSGRDTSGALNSGQPVGDITFQYGGFGGGFRQWISTWHNNGATGNYFKFYLNTQAGSTGSSAPGTGNIQAFSIGNEGVAAPNGYVQTGVTVVASLPAAAAGNKGARYFVTDATQAFTAGIGAIVAGGGANNVPVTSDGTNWRIG